MSKMDIDLSSVIKALNKNAGRGYKAYSYLSVNSLPVKSLAKASSHIGTVRRVPRVYDT